MILWFVSPVLLLASYFNQAFLFIYRFSDISCAIRIHCVNFVPELVANHSFLVEDLAGGA